MASEGTHCYPRVAASCSAAPGVEFGAGHQTHGRRSIEITWVLVVNRLLAHPASATNATKTETARGFKHD